MKAENNPRSGARQTSELSRSHPTGGLRPLLQLTMLAGLAGGGFLVAYALTEHWNTTSAEPRKHADEVAEAPRLPVRGGGDKVAAAPALPSVGHFLPSVENESSPPAESPLGMVWIPGGEFSMGCDDPRASLCGGPDPMPDARPIHRVYVDGFWMDKTEVTNAEFTRFADATGYVTVAEKTPQAKDFPGAPAEKLVAGSVVFAPTEGPVPLDIHYRWWSYMKGANWRHPLGPESDLVGKEDFPVVHVAYDDAVAYCRWAGKRLPTEAEWEFAARGGAAGELYAWGNELQPEGRWMANIYQGRFPINGGDAGKDGFVGVAPVARFPANRYGLYDIGGNVWEWCSDWYRPDYYAMLAENFDVAHNPQGPDWSLDPDEPNQPKRVHRGGSFLCTDKYCTRYMVGSRGKGEVSTGSNHLGFRCVKSP